MPEELELPNPSRRINVSVEVLEERLRNWADDIKREQNKVFDELRRLSDRHDRDYGSLDLWRVQAQITIDYIRADVDELKAQAARRDELELVKKKADDIQRQIETKEIAGSAKMQLLKSQWTWLIAGAFGASTIIGLLVQLRVVEF